MNAFSRTSITIALATALSAPLALYAAEQTAGDHNSHHPAQIAAGTGTMSTQQGQDQMQAQMQTRMQGMMGRMQAMQQTTDPQARMPIMMAQMQDMQAMMKDMGMACPMASGMGGQGMMGNGMHGGAAMGGQMPPPRDPAAAPAK